MKARLILSYIGVVVLAGVVEGCELHARRRGFCGCTVLEQQLHNLQPPMQ